MRFIRHILIVVLLTGCAGTSQLTVEQGVAAFDEGNYNEAIELLIPLADKNNEQAAYWTGRSYEAEALKGEKQLLNDAADWYLVAARQGHEDAAYRLGRIFIANGHEDAGVRLLQGAASCGHTDAASLLREGGFPMSGYRCPDNLADRNIGLAIGASPQGNSAKTINQ